MVLDRDLMVQALPAYEVGDELGRGGWGVVLGGRHLQLGREVAIKQLPRAFGADRAVRARFAAEARLLASLDHPHIVPVYDFVEREGLCLLVMEMMSGGTVWSRFTSTGLTMDSACAITLATCAALHCAHGHNVLHRDIKPENLLFTEAGVMKVADFGIAKVIGGPQTLATRAGEVLGTPAYMAPEQAQGAEVTPATDVYATGTMLYELLSGRLPFDEDGDALALLYRHVYEQPRPLHEVAPDVPEVIADVVMRAIATNPADRFSSVEGFGVALAESATAAWEPGWLGRGNLPVMAASSIVAATERPSQPGTYSRLGARPEASRPASAGPAPPTEPEPVPEASPLPKTRVRPTVTVRAPGRAVRDDEELDLVPVHEVLRPPRATGFVLSSLALLLLAVLVAFAGGSPKHVRSQPGTIVVNGIDASSGEDIVLDLSDALSVTATPGPDAPRPTRMTIRFSLLGLPLGTASALVEPDTDGSFTASLDVTSSRYLVAGQVTSEVELRDDGGSLAVWSFPVTSRQPTLMTVPAIVGIALFLFTLAYVESLLRSRRRGRKPVTGTVGMMLTGAAGGIAVVVATWLASAREPVVETVVICAALGAGSGLAASLAAARVGRRRRFRPPKAEASPRRDSAPM